MHKTKLFKILVFLVIVLAIYKVANYYVKDKVTELLHAQNIRFQDISTNLLFGNINLEEVDFSKDSLHLNAERLEVNNVSYYQYLKNKSINIAEFKAVNPVVNGKFIEKENEKENETPKNTGNKDELDLTIDHILLENLKVDLQKKNNYPLTAQSIHLDIEDFKLEANPEKTIPFSYSDIKASIVNFETQYSKVQKIKFSKLDFEDSDLSLDSLEIVPLKKKKEYIYHVPEKKELLTLFVKQVLVSDIAIEENQKLSFSTKNILLDEFFFNIYLDLTFLKHPNKRKDLYSKSLRDLPFDINVENVDIKNSELVYQEYTVKGNKAGILIFDDLNAQIKNINNHKERQNKLTTATIQSKFMRHCPLDIEWSFDINNTNDKFRIKGSLFDVSSKNMSSFLLPTMNVKMDGFIDKMYFDFEGNDYTSNGNLNLDFRNFNIKILDEDKDRKTIISWLANLFIKDSSKNGFVKVEVENVERDTTRSFWNYFWKNIEKGLQNSLL